MYNRLQLHMIGEGKEWRCKTCVTLEEKSGGAQEIIFCKVVLLFRITSNLQNAGMYLRMCEIQQKMKAGHFDNKQIRKK